jgi:hypothetical protein
MKTPEAPDPMKTAQAQGGMNRDTAITQQQLNMVDQYNPWGSVINTQTGTNRFKDSQGNWVETPKFTQTTNLSPAQQAIFEQTQRAQGNLAGIAEDQSGAMREYLSTPFEFDNQDAANWAYDLGAQRLDPRFEQERSSMEAQLINRGIRPGTAAYDAEMSRFGQTKNDAYNQLMLQGRSQAFGEALSTRNQPINELSALMSGSQVSNPAQMSGAAPQTGVGGVDYTGLVNQKYQADLANSQAKMGGLFGLAGAGLSLFSDARLKSDIKRVGSLDSGLGVYTYRFGNGPVQMGVMAQEVSEIIPDAVHKHSSGYLMVEYGKVA